MNSNKRKSKQLGIAHGTAANRLRKMIMFDLIQKVNLDTCFHCNEKIETIDEFSIEHKIPWLDSNDPLGLFFNLDNISFSHLSCNCSTARKAHKIKNPKGKNWCWKCKSFRDYEEFSPANMKRNLCRECQAERMREYRR